MSLLKVYIDESGQETRNEVVVAGYVGYEEAWTSLEAAWRDAISPRSHLHMADLRWKHRRTDELIKRITGVPEGCGLQRIIGGVDVRYYADLFPEHILKRFAAGYTAALRYFLSTLMSWMPANERVHLYFERQDPFTLARNECMAAFADMRCYFTNAGVSRIEGWESIDKCTRLEPADALAYAALVDVRNHESRNARLTRPLLGDRKYGRFGPRKEMRSVSRLQFQLTTAGVDVDLFDSYARRRAEWLRSMANEPSPANVEFYQVPPEAAIDLLRQVVVRLLGEKYRPVYGTAADELAEAVFNFAVLTEASSSAVAKRARDESALVEVLSAGVHLDKAVAQPMSVAYCVRHIQFSPTYARLARDLESRSRLLRIPILNPHEVFDTDSGSAFLITVAVYARSLLNKHKAHTGNVRSA